MIVKTSITVIGFLSIALSAQCQTNVYKLNYTWNGFITVGNNRATVSAPKSLTKIYSEQNCPAPTVGSPIRFTAFSMPTDNRGDPICEWCVISVTNLGSVLNDKESGSEWAKTDGKFVKIAFRLSNLSDRDLYLEEKDLSIWMQHNKNQWSANPQFPHMWSDRIVGKDEELSSRTPLPPGMTRIYSVVYEVPLNVISAKLDVFSLKRGYTDSDGSREKRASRVGVKLW